MKNRAINRKSYKKKEIQENVYEFSKTRFEHIFKSFDTVAIAFSGGKDSTAVLNVALEVAKKMNRLPLKVIFFDEECITFETIEFVERTMKRPEVDLEWYCVNVKHRNACSNLEPWWWSWDPAKKDLWVREIPSCAITEIPGFNGFTDSPDTGVKDAMNCLFQDRKFGKVCIVTGIRTQESLRRFKCVTNKKNENFIMAEGEGKMKNLSKAHPIYDWMAEDVWIGVSKFGWDYNITYDIFNMTGINGKLSAQRICAPFGEEPLRGLWIYKECFPKYWAKLSKRVLGANSAMLYSNTELYSVGMKRPPEGLTWQQFSEVILSNYIGKELQIISKNLTNLINQHKFKSILDIPEEISDPLSGVSWKFICLILVKGDFKRRTSGTATIKAMKTLKKLDITFQEAVIKYGTDKYKKYVFEKYAYLFPNKNK